MGNGGLIYATGFSSFNMISVKYNLLDPSQPGSNGAVLYLTSGLNVNLVDVYLESQITEEQNGGLVYIQNVQHVEVSSSAFLFGDTKSYGVSKLYFNIKILLQK